MRYKLFNDLMMAIILLLLILGKWLSDFSPSNTMIAILIIGMYFAQRAEE